MRNFSFILISIFLISAFSISGQRTTRKLLKGNSYNDSCLYYDSIYNSKQIQLPEKDSTVYICTGSSSKCFHSTRDCKGLNNCNGTIKALKVSKASKKHRKCKICFKKR